MITLWYLLGCLITLVVPELRICEFCLFPIEDVSGGKPLLAQ